MTAEENVRARRPAEPATKSSNGNGHGNGHGMVRNTSFTAKKENGFLKEFNNSLAQIKFDKSSYHLTRVVLVRYLAFIYFVAFLVAFNQNKELLGKSGLRPANRYMDRLVRDYSKSLGRDALDEQSPLDLVHKAKLFFKCPTLFWFFNWSESIDFLLDISSITGLALSMFVMLMGAANVFIVLALWLLYHSIVNVGQNWYSFGWESQLLESGFVALFLVPLYSIKPIDFKSPPSIVPILLYRWLIFRIMLGAGLIKIRGDKCWLDYTCMNYHYETQPVPNPLSYYMHHEPEAMHKFEVLSNHFLELVAPFMLLVPHRLTRQIGGTLQIIFQVVLIISGNLSFLNWLTILPCLACFDDTFYARFFNKKPNSIHWKLLKHLYFKNIKDSKFYIELEKSNRSTKTFIRKALSYFLVGIIAYLSLPVITNLLSPSQAMNTSFEPFRIVNTYGAFGSITKTRNEVIFKGARVSGQINENTTWVEYEFKCKPGGVSRRPCLISPYHYRLDWLLWFAAFQSYEYHPWILSLAGKFFLNDKNFTRHMIAHNPFEGLEPPNYIKADLYRYKYTKPSDNSTAWWRRKFVKAYLPPITRNHIDAYLEDLGWVYEH